MKFVKTEGTAELEAALTASLAAALATTEPVLWIVTGGSNIVIEAKIMAALDPAHLRNLTIILTDERFGPVGHEDSNYFQLHFQDFAEREALFMDMLYGASFEDTVKTANESMKVAFQNAKHVVALIGMGPDGHIAGILPNSPAAVADEKWVIGYDGGQYQRFTLTPFALSHIHEAFVGTFGPERLEPLTKLHDKMLSIAEQPAQILRHLPSVTIYNDQIEGDI